MKHDFEKKSLNFLKYTFKEKVVYHVIFFFLVTLNASFYLFFIIRSDLQTHFQLRIWYDIFDSLIMEIPFLKRKIKLEKRHA